MSNYVTKEELKSEVEYTISRLEWLLASLKDEDTLDTDYDIDDAYELLADCYHARVSIARVGRQCLDKMLDRLEFDFS